MMVVGQRCRITEVIKSKVSLVVGDVKNYYFIYIRKYIEKIIIDYKYKEKYNKKCLSEMD